MLTRNKRRIDEYFGDEDTISLISTERDHENSEVVEQRNESDSLTKVSDAKRKKVVPRALDGTFFEIVTECGDKIEAKCKQCEEIKKGSAKSTGNFLNHYKSRHPKEFEHLEKHVKVAKFDCGNFKPQQPQISEHFPPLTQKEISNQLLNFVIDTNLPYDIIRSPALHTLLESIGRRKILMPKKGVFMKNLEEKFSAMKAKLIEILAEQKYLCLTCDVWSSRACSFIGVTVHYKSKDFQNYSHVLAFRKLKGKQTYFELGSEIEKTLNEFNIPKSKITNIVTDGGSAFCKAFKEYGKGNDVLVEEIVWDEAIENIENVKDSDKAEDCGVDLPFMQNDDGELFYCNSLNFEQMNLEENDDESENDTNFQSDEHELFRDLVPPNQCESSVNRPKMELPPQRRCLSHLLNLISSDFEKSLPPVVKSAFINAYNKLHALWIFTHRSSHARSICERILGCVLLVPCETRWNSKYYAIEKACRNEIKNKINELISELTKEIKGATHLQPLSTNDWAVLSEYLKVMSPIAQSLNRLQSENNGSQGMIMPILISMRYHINSLEGSTLLKNFKKNMLEVVQVRFGNYFNFNVLNRDLVLASITLPVFKVNFIEHDFEEKRALELLKDECYQLLRNNQFERNEVRESDTAAKLDDFFVEFTHRSQARRYSIENDIESEINRYFSDKRTETSMLNEYPTIKELYFRYNTTLSASAAVERVFSQCALIFRPHRNRISAENFEKTLLLKYNRKILKN